MAEKVWFQVVNAEDRWDTTSISICIGPVTLKVAETLAEWEAFVATLAGMTDEIAENLE